MDRGNDGAFREEISLPVGKKRSSNTSPSCPPPLGFLSINKESEELHLSARRAQFYPWLY